MSDSPSTTVSLPRNTQGKRPHFFADRDLDQMMTFILELTTEVAVMRERQDTVERLLDQHGQVTREQIENYLADDTVEASRVEWRDAYLRRVLRRHPA